MTRKEVLTYVKETYDVEADYPWARTPNYAIFRHARSRKWFGAIVDITEDKLGLPGNRLVDALNLKCDPIMVGSLRNEAGIFPAYHMNKEHWLTVLLDGTVARETVCSLLHLSYDLTR